MCIRDSHRVVLLVPEQFSFEAERRVYRRFTGEQLRRIEVVSFMRLANSVFRAYGGLAGTYADASDKTILMNLALGEDVYKRQGPGRQNSRGALRKHPEILSLL